MSRGKPGTGDERFVLRFKSGGAIGENSELKPLLVQAKSLGDKVESTR